MLNNTLYELLKKVFGSVKVANKGVKAHVRYIHSGSNHRAMVTGGEYYQVNCPLCGDTGKHLWVSYMFGTYDKRVSAYLTHVAVCYRCNAPGAMQEIRKVLNGQTISAVQVIESEEPALVETTLPEGKYIPAADLKPEHPAVKYMAGRGYPVREIGKHYNWLYCEDAENNLLVRRLVFPIYHMFDDGHVGLVGCQARAIPHLSAASKPKYWTMAGFRKSLVLYNYHIAKRQPVVVVTEGLLDAVRVGLGGVAVFGHSLSSEQRRLLLRLPSTTKIVVMLDADALAHAWTMKESLRGGLSDVSMPNVYLARLPFGDPGEFTSKQLAAYVDDAIRTSEEANAGSRLVS